MKSEVFKKLIKESVKEAIREELISSLIEVLNNNKPNIEPPTKLNKLGLKEEIRSKIPKPDFKFTTENITNLVSPTQTTPTSQPYNPGNVNTSGNGSALPAGEVSMDQIANLMNSK